MTAMIIRWPKHIKAPCRCDKTYEYCNGCMLMTCSTCGASEGELSTDCPGERMTRNQRMDVQFGRLDYTAGRGWTAYCKGVL